MLDPNSFIITKKRKKYKFALFSNSPLCFEFEEWKKAAVDIVEVGAGTGLFSVELASQQPDKQFVAVDVKADRLQKGALEAENRGLTNIRFVRARADQLDEMIVKGSVSKIWITFADPFPKKRSAGRRLSHPTYLSTYTKLLSKQGNIYIKHDSREFFLWSLEQLIACHWHIKELSFDLHTSDLDASYKIMTTYEKRWIEESGVINFVRAQPSKGAAGPTHR